MITFRATLGKIWTTFYSNIWSHCLGPILKSMFGIQVWHRGLQIPQWTVSLQRKKICYFSVTWNHSIDQFHVVWIGLKIKIVKHFGKLNQPVNFWVWGYSYRTGIKQDQWIRAIIVVDANLNLLLCANNLASRFANWTRSHKQISTLKLDRAHSDWLANIFHPIRVLKISVA